MNKFINYIFYSLFFLLFSTYFFQKWHQLKYKKISLNLILHLIFLALTLSISPS